MTAAMMLTLGMTACGGDDDEADDGTAAADTAGAVTDDGDEGEGDGGDGGENQNEAADIFIEQAEAAGIETDEDCVREKAEKLSDADAQAIVDAGDDGSPQLSPEGEALSIELASCISTEDLIEEVLSSLPEGIDEDCVREAMEGVDLSNLAGGETPPEFAAAIGECVTGG
jgi:hypothetical protein